METSCEVYALPLRRFCPSSLGGTYLWHSHSASARVSCRPVGSSPCMLAFTDARRAQGTGLRDHGSVPLMAIGMGTHLNFTRGAKEGPVGTALALGVPAMTNSRPHSPHPNHPPNSLRALHPRVTLHRKPCAVGGAHTTHPEGTVPSKDSCKRDVG